MSPRRLTDQERLIAELRSHMSEHGWYYGHARTLLDEIAGAAELAANGGAYGTLLSEEEAAHARLVGENASLREQLQGATENIASVERACGKAIEQWKAAADANTRLEKLAECRLADVRRLDGENTRLREALADVVAHAERLLNHWPYITAQEMYGEALRASLTATCFREWDRLHTRLREAIARSDKSTFRQPIEKLKCGACGHEIEQRADLIRELRESGGDGPYCIECHKTGRPDVLMVVSDDWSTGKPRT